MNSLLPKAVGEFSTNTYWQQFFTDLQQHGEGAFEWWSASIYLLCNFSCVKYLNTFFHRYGSYNDLQKCLERYIKASDKILQIGCGNSTLADHMYDNGYRNITSVDIVDDIIKKQRQRNKKRRPELVFETKDATKSLSDPSGPYNVVLDKGTLGLQKKLINS